MLAVLKDPAARADARTIGVVGAAHGTSHFFHLLLPPLFPWLMADFGLNFTQAGLLMTLFFTVSGIGQALAGFLVDRVGARRVLYAGVGLLALAAFVLAGAGGHGQLLATAALAGLGNSLFHPADYSLLNHRVARERLGHAFSVHGLMGNLGWALAPVFLVAIASQAGWRVAALAAGLVGLAMLILLISQRAALAPVSHEETPGATPAPSALAFLALPGVWLCFGFFLLGTMAFGALQNYTPGALGALYGLSLALGTSALSAYLLGGALGVLIGGFLANRGEDHDRVIGLALGAAAALALLIASGLPPTGSLLGLMVLMGVGSGIAGPSRDMLVRKAATGALGQRAYGRIYGFVYSGLDSGLALAPLLFGPLMDRGHPSLVLVGVALLQLLAIGTALGVGARARAVPVQPGRATASSTSNP